MVDADLCIEDARWQDHGDLDALTHAAVHAAVTQIEMQTPASVCILFADDAAQRVLNHEHRGLDKSTNVLSFPAAPTPLPEGMPKPLGDISLAYETVMAEAQSGPACFEAHLQHLIIHGLLHLLGYDHEEEREATLMETTETKALARLGHPDPYSAQQVHDQ